MFEWVINHPDAVITLLGIFTMLIWHNINLHFKLKMTVDMLRGVRERTYKLEQKTAELIGKSTLDRVIAEFKAEMHEIRDDIKNILMKMGKHNE